MRRHPVAAVAAVIFLTGCGTAERAAGEARQKLADAVAKLEGIAAEIVAAIDSGDPMAADGPMHKIIGPIDAIEQFGGRIGLDESIAKSISTAREKVVEALGVLHGPMHHGGFPDDFDFASAREGIVQAMAGLRDALPEPVAKLLGESPIRAEPPADKPPTEPAAEPAPDKTSAARRVPTGEAVVAMQRAPLCPSVTMWDDASLAAAPERINRVAELLADAPPHARWVQIVPTLHAQLAADNAVTSLGLLRERDGPPDDSANFALADNGLADRLRRAYAEAIGQAVRRGLSVAMLLHIDAAGSSAGAWRNTFRFAPDADLGGGSYESLLIEPLADAIEQHAGVGLRFDLALSGEMTRSLLEHPDAYRRIVDRLRDRFAASPQTAGVAVGVALNWDGDNGGASPTAAERAGFAALVEGCDFVGFSCYAPVSVPPTPDDFARATARFLDELHKLAGRPVRPQRLVMSEVGLGGGVPQPGGEGVVYPAPKEVAASPWEGRGRPRFDPWKDPALRQLRRDFHTALLGYLSTPKPRVEKAFLWTEGPWDPQGVDTERFVDEEITQAIAEHNRAGASF